VSYILIYVNHAYRDIYLLTIYLELVFVRNLVYLWYVRKSKPLPLVRQGLINNEESVVVPL